MLHFSGPMEEALIFVHSIIKMNNPTEINEVNHLTYVCLQNCIELGFSI